MPVPRSLVGASEFIATTSVASSYSSYYSSLEKYVL